MPSVSAEKSDLVRLGFEILVVRMREHKIEDRQAALDEVQFVGSAVADVFAFNAPVQPAREHMIDHAALRKPFDARMPQALELGPESGGSFAPMGTGKFEELAGNEITGMRGHQIEKTGFLFAIAEGEESFEMGLRDVHRERISAVRSRSLRMRRSRGASSAGL